MERLTYDFCVGNTHCWQVKGADNFLCEEVCINQGDSGCEECLINKAFERLAAYEDAMSMERAQELAQADKDGRLVKLPKVSVLDRKSFADGLQDYFQEANYCDTSTGIFGMSDGEKDLAFALMNVLTHSKPVSAEKREKADNEAD